MATSKTSKWVERYALKTELHELSNIMHKDLPTDLQDLSDEIRETKANVSSHTARLKRLQTLDFSSMLESADRRQKLDLADAFQNLEGMQRSLVEDAEREVNAAEVRVRNVEEESEKLTEQLDKLRLEQTDRDKQAEDTKKELDSQHQREVEQLKKDHSAELDRSAREIDSRARKARLLRTLLVCQWILSQSRMKRLFQLVWFMKWRRRVEQSKVEQLKKDHSTELNRSAGKISSRAREARDLRTLLGSGSDGNTADDAQDSGSAGSAFVGRVLGFDSGSTGAVEPALEPPGGSWSVRG
ncbi:hypothetical protein LTR37_009347 [Vermiconidia calcicola]|uniref:Uncharacterized protein n=1 Tax=Vermiconidia calcicola TaxID=1690605 RepID=A0ACC3N7Q2_9PEZI|nr:hypothetical protein LTR37_009347 [Vermiconidia calcicola]